MTVPVAVAALVPVRVDASVTAVLGGTEMEVPDFPPPDRDVESMVVVLDITVSTSPDAPHVLVDGRFFTSPE